MKERLKIVSQTEEKYNNDIHNKRIYINELKNALNSMKRENNKNDEKLTLIKSKNTYLESKLHKLGSKV